VTEQLLHVASLMDMSDEAGRRRLSATLRTYSTRLSDQTPLFPMIGGRFFGVIVCIWSSYDSHNLLLSAENLIEDRKVDMCVIPVSLKMLGMLFPQGAEFTRYVL